MICKNTQRDAQDEVQERAEGGENDYSKEVKGQEEQTVADYLEENGYRMNRIAVELNGEILPKYKYSETRLKDGDSMEIVTFVGGG